MIMAKMAQKRMFFAFVGHFLPLLVQHLFPLVVLATQKTPRKTGDSILLE
jgi:hypothetical protein